MPNLLEIVLTDTTCGEACWHAREDVCRCSCGGKNHGCLRTPDGVQPERTCVIDGVRRRLAAVGYDGIEKQAQALNAAAGITYYYAHNSREYYDRDIPAKTRVATQSQVAKWPELAAYRENLPENWKAAHPDSCRAEWPGMPDLLWVRIEG